MALQWTPLRLIMTGENGVERRRSDIYFNDYRHRGLVRMLDKEVQVEYNPNKLMEYENADSGLGGSGDLATVTVVEINSSTDNNSSHYHNNNNSSDFTNSSSINNNNNNNNNNNSSVLSESNINQHDNERIIRRESIDRLHELQENNEGYCLADAVDYATLPADCRMNSLSADQKGDNDVDEIRDPSLVMLNNTANREEKLKDLPERADDANCLLDCLSFTVQCCDCTIL